LKKGLKYPISTRGKNRNRKTLDENTILVSYPRFVPPGNFSQMENGSGG
jgi:hypothetical protein